MAVNTKLKMNYIHQIEFIVFVKKIGFFSQEKNIIIETYDGIF